MLYRVDHLPYLTDDTQALFVFIIDFLLVKAGGDEEAIANCVAEDEFIDEITITIQETSLEIGVRSLSVDDSFKRLTDVSNQEIKLDDTHENCCNVPDKPNDIYHRVC